MGRDGRTTGSGVGVQGTDGEQAWGGCTVRDLDSMSKTKGDRGGWWDMVTEGKVKCVKD